MSLHHLPTPLPPEIREAVISSLRRERYEGQMLRDLETDLAGVHLSPLGYQHKAAAMTSLIDGAAERLAWIERTS